MCLAIPGKVIEINDNIVTIDYKGNQKIAKTIFKVKVGDYVYVNGGIVVEKIPNIKHLLKENDK